MRTRPWVDYSTHVREESTIRTHVKRTLMKLDLRDQVQAVIFAYETGVNQPVK